MGGVHYIYILYICIYTYHSIALFFSLKCASIIYIYIYYSDWIQPASDSPTPPKAFITTQLPRFRVEPQRIAVKPPSLLSEWLWHHPYNHSRVQQHQPNPSLKTHLPRYFNLNQQFPMVVCEHPHNFWKKELIIPLLMVKIHDNQS